MSRGGYWKEQEINGKRIFTWDWSKTRLSISQARLFFSDAKKKAVMAGRGWGKDHVSLEEKVLKGQNRYHRRTAGLDDSVDGKAGLVYHLGVMAGESGSYDDNINKLKTFLPHLPGRGVGGRPMYRFDRKEQYFELFGENQFRISMISLFGDSGQRGPGYDDVLVTEAQDITEDKFLSVVLPMVIRPGYEGNITVVGTGKCNWFDAMCEQARDGVGFYGDYEFHTGTTFDNPKLTMEVAEQILREYDKNPGRFQRERLGLPNVLVTPDEKPDCPFHEGLVACSLSRERLTLTGPPLIVADLIYGGEDKLCVGVWDKPTNSLVRLFYYTSKDLGLTTNDPYSGLTRFFTSLAQQYPGCAIAYDAQGQFGGKLQDHVPRHIKLVPMRRTREQKNTMVESVIERMGIHDNQGRSVGIRLPHPDSQWLDAQQKQNILKLLTDLYNYRRVVMPATAGGPTKYYYTKGEGFEDDGPDMLSWSTSQLLPVNRTPLNVKSAAKALRRGLYT